MRLRKKHTPVQPKLCIAAMIDIVFLLIIFFMATSQFSRAHAQRVALPNADHASPRHTAVSAMTLTLASDGQLSRDGQPATIDELRTQLAAMSVEERSQLKVSVRADKTASWKLVRDVLAACASQGVVHVTSAVTPEAQR